ncbi:MAG TPA: hypothetical protein VGW34_03950 [Allosphingosinicella sp.]|nr:hypothetical protein [Allosphingosinicella sp.]
MIGVLLLSAAIGAAPPVLPEYEVGDAFVFSDGRVERVRQVRADRVVWSGLGRSTYERSRNPVVPILAWNVAGVAGHRQIGEAADALWPLRPGKSVRFRAVTQVDRKGARRRSVAFWKCGVGAPGTVTVPAGRFEAWPIQCERYSAATMRLVERVQWDWSPELSHYVRRRVTLYFDGSTSEIRLAAALAGDAATKARLRALSAQARGASAARLQGTGQH